ncbi:hypothetical protein [Borrelia sp. HM]|uniref:hypothetical protein n=1 Tax=Borrelia sp. HM TaxID=1882662 RepID=UPI001C770744|nr:hypothetical protein [Borrelia sp. HM]BCR21706.1 hypothetical protein BKFM_00272 [Borrelia sp. HM]
MLLNKLNKYVLLFSTFAFILSVLLGILARVTFIAILFRALFLFIVFFCIGLLLDFIYKKHFYNLFQSDSLGDDTTKKDFNEDIHYKPKSDSMHTFSEDVSFNNVNDCDDNIKFAKELSTFDRDIQTSKLKGGLSNQVSYIEKTDPKIVAETIKILINDKEE